RLAGGFIGLEVNKWTGRPGWGWNVTIRVCGKHAADPVGAVNSSSRREQHCGVKVNKAGGGITDKHLCAIKCKDASLKKHCPCLVKLVISHVVGIRPHAEVRIVVELIIRHHKIVKII